MSTHPTRSSATHSELLSEYLNHLVETPVGRRALGYREWFAHRFAAPVAVGTSLVLGACGGASESDGDGGGRAGAEQGQGGQNQAMGGSGEAIGGWEGLGASGGLYGIELGGDWDRGGAGQGGNTPTTETECRDGLDNDRDGSRDCDDSDCIRSISCMLDYGAPLGGTTGQGGAPEFGGSPGQGGYSVGGDAPELGGGPGQGGYSFGGDAPDYGIAGMGDDPESDCSNRLDDDRDGFVDCDDLDCSPSPECTVVPYGVWMGGAAGDGGAGGAAGGVPADGGWSGMGAPEYGIWMGGSSGGGGEQGETAGKAGQDNRAGETGLGGGGEKYGMDMSDP